MRYIRAAITVVLGLSASPSAKAEDIMPSPPFSLSCSDTARGISFRIAIETYGYAVSLGGSDQFVTRKMPITWSNVQNAVIDSMRIKGDDRGILKQLVFPIQFLSDTSPIGELFLSFPSQNSAKFSISGDDEGAMDTSPTLGDGTCTFIKRIVMPPGIRPDKAFQYTDPDDKAVQKI